MLQGTKSDEELMASYQGGSEQAFAVLYARHSEKIFGYLVSRATSLQEAADLFQEIFIKIHKSKHLYNSSLPLLPWIFSVAHSVLIDGRRSYVRKREVFDYEFNQISAGQSEASLLDSVTPLIKKLPNNQSVAIQMRYIDEKTFVEIAASLKTSPINVRKIISRGIINLKRLLREVGLP